MEEGVKSIFGIPHIQIEKFIMRIGLFTSPPLGLASPVLGRLLYRVKPIAGIPSS